MEYINLNKIIGADIIKPHKNSGEPWDVYPDNGWKVSIIVGFLPDGQERNVLIDKKTRKECQDLIGTLGLNAL